MFFFGLLSFLTFSCDFFQLQLFFCKTGHVCEIQKEEKKTQAKFNLNIELTWKTQVRFGYCLGSSNALNNIPCQLLLLTFDLFWKQFKGTKQADPEIKFIHYNLLANKCYVKSILYSQKVSRASWDKLTLSESLMNCFDCLLSLMQLQQKNIVNVSKSNRHSKRIQTQ